MRVPGGSSTCCTGPHMLLFRVLFGCQNWWDINIGHTAFPNFFGEADPVGWGVGGAVGVAAPTSLWFPGSSGSGCSHLGLRSQCVLGVATPTWSGGGAVCVASPHFDIAHEIEWEWPLPFRLAHPIRSGSCVSHLAALGAVQRFT